MKVSRELIKYIKKEKKRKCLINTLRILVSVLFILIWQLLADNNIINTFITSSPKGIYITLINLYSANNLFIHIITTLNEIILSFIITTILSILIAILLYNSELLSNVLDPYLTMLNSLPKVALGPIIIIVFGANTKGIITMAILISVIISIQTIYNGFINTDKLKIKLMQTFNASKKDILFKLVIPSNKSVILNTLKINISMCLVGVIMGEFLTSKAGIGYLILYGSQIFNLDLVYTGIFILIVISALLYILVSSLEKKLNH